MKIRNLYHPRKRDVETKAMIDNYVCSLLNFHYLRHKGECEVDYTMGIILEIRIPRLRLTLPIAENTY